MSEQVRLPLQFNLPLSGAVTQSFALPFSTGAQFGLFNINLGDSSNAALEQQLISKVGSYGRQLGRLCDAVEVLVKKLDRQNLSTADQHALQAFQQMAEAIRHAKAGHK